jgi:hypothetical protein
LPRHADAAQPTPEHTVQGKESNRPVVSVASKGRTSLKATLGFVYKGKLYLRVPGDPRSPADSTGYTLWGSISLSRRTGDRILSIDGISLSDG